MMMSVIRSASPTGNPIAGRTIKTGQIPLLKSRTPVAVAMITARKETIDKPIEDTTM